MGWRVILVSSLLLPVLFNQARAQHKYALLVGINDYYEVKGIKSKESLKGSVNDANAIRDVLLHRFGFAGKDIDTVYNADATRDNIIAALEKKLKLCRKGDMMFFYYSGHGVYLKNSEEDNDPVKAGFNQAMLTSDLYNYSDQFKCFLRDFTLKRYFNLFIDKQVVLTTIFDCCYSGNLAMASGNSEVTYSKTRAVDLDELMSRLTATAADPQQLIDSLSGNISSRAAGCPVSRADSMEASRDSDGDGVPDCRDDQVHTEPACFPVNAKGIGSCPYTYFLNRTLNSYDSAELQQNTGLSVRSFNSTEVLHISEKDTIARPASRKNSGFLFISGTTDYQKALEFPDSNKTIHGLFTGSFVRVCRLQPPGTRVDSLFSRVQRDMAGYHKNQQPTIHLDPARAGDDLSGIKASRARIGKSR